MIRLLIATRNRHKVEEIQVILGAGFACETLTHYPNAPVVIEDADTFAGNAVKKAETIATWLRQSSKAPAVDYVMADDSGLEVDALGGAPGVHSARFAALDTGAPGNSPDAENNAKLLRLLLTAAPEKRTGRFRCAIALINVKTKQLEIFDGACEGRIGTTLSGKDGFGYDPLFVPDGFRATFAELGESVKNGLSHRAKALAQMRAAFVSKHSRSNAV